MRLYLAVAVLLLAFVTYTEAQDVGIRETLENARTHLSDLYESFKKTETVQKFKTGVEDLMESIKNNWLNARN